MLVGLGLAGCGSDTTTSSFDSDADNEAKAAKELKAAQYEFCTTTFADCVLKTTTLKPAIEVDEPTLVACIETYYTCWPAAKPAE